MVASAYDAKKDGIYYNFYGNEATVTFKDYEYNSYSGAVVIPASVTYNSRTYNVTRIDNDAFRDCSDLTSVTIGNSVKHIGANSFCYCSGLTSVIIGNSVTTIDNSAFYGSSSLTSITIPNSVTRIGESVFSGCSSLTSVSIGNSVTSIGNSVFSGCSCLTSITIPGSVTTIGYMAFYNCSSLTSVAIPNSVTSIGNSAFYGCNSLNSVTIPNRVTSIGSYTFYDCSSLTSVTIPNSVTSIGDWAFYDCSSLTSVTIPNSVTSIGHYAFYFCSGLTSVTIPNSVTSIGKQAFYSCSGLTSVTIPNSLTSIGEEAFYYCSGINTIYITDLSAWCNFYTNTTSSPIFSSYYHLYLNGEEISHLTIPENTTRLGNYVFYGCRYITSVTIPNSVMTIGESAFENCYNMETLRLPEELKIIKKATFRGCSSLKSVTIPGSVEFIYQEAFANCSGLESVKALPENPPFLYDNSFSYYNIPLYAPETAIETYKSTNPWSKFAQFFTLDGSEVVPKQCSKPTITYANGQLKFESETEGVEFKSSIRDTDINDYTASIINLTATYTITVYATKAGYENSEVATATLCWIDVEPQTEGLIDEDAVAEVKAQPVLIQSQGGTISIQGAAEGTNVSVYSVNGMLQGSAIATQGLATIETTLHPGSVAIVKIGEKTIKVVIK